jgi:hypothetical protein
LAIALGLVVSGSAPRAHAVVYFSPVRGELSLEFDGLRIEQDDGPTEGEYLFEERFRIKSSGYVLHPGIVTFSVELAPAASQQMVRHEDFDGDHDNWFLDYFLDLGILKSRPLSFDASAMSSSGTTTSGIGNRREFEVDTYRAGATFSNPYFPVGVRYTKRFLEQREKSGASSDVFDTDEEEDTLAVWGRSSKLNVSYERSWFDDKEEDRSQTTDTGRLSHRLLRWGKGSSLDYDVDYLDRDGFLPFRRFATNERLHLQHTPDLYTLYSHNYTYLERDLETRSHLGDVSLNHRLYRNLNTRVFLSASTTDSDDEDATGYSGGLGLSYNKRLAGNGTLKLGTTGAYRIDDIRTKNGLSEVVGEVHIVDTTGIFFLNRRFISLDTIVVNNADRTIVYVEGQDYAVNTVDELTQIQVLLGGRIGIGDVLLVDYLFETLPSREFSTTTYSYDAGLDYGWVSVYHRGAFTRQDLLSGSDGTSLIDTDDFTTGVVFSLSHKATRATVGGEHRYTKYDGFQSDTYSLRQSLQHPLSRRVSLTFNASQTFFDADGSDFVTFSERLLVQWRPRRSLTLDLHGEHWERQEDDDFEERFWEVGPEVRWFVGRVEFNSRYSHREWGGVYGDRAEDRLTVAFKRAF